MFIQAKGKGMMVPVYGLISFIVLLLLTKFIDEYFFSNKLPEIFYGLAMCCSMFLAGLWTYLTATDHYVNEHGEKKPFVMDHQFMFIKMKYWPYLYWCLACIIVAKMANEYYKGR